MNGAETAPPPPAGRYRSGSDRRTLYIVLAVIAAGVVLGGLALVGFVIFLVSSTETTEVTDQEFALLITAGDLVAHFEGLEVDPEHEFATRTSFFDDSFDLDYEYDHPDPDLVLSLQSSISVEAGERDARDAFSVLVIGTLAGFALGSEAGTNRREDNDFFTAGDQSRHYFVTRAGEDIGHLLFIRTGNKLMSLTVVGAHFEAAADLGEVVLPRLEALGRYDPAEAEAR